MRPARHEAEHFLCPLGWTGIPCAPPAPRPSISVVLWGGQESQASRPPPSRAFPLAFRADRNPKRPTRHEVEHFRRLLGEYGYVSTHVQHTRTLGYAVPWRRRFNLLMVACHHEEAQSCVPAQCMPHSARVKF